MQLPNRLRRVLIVGAVAMLLAGAATVAGHFSPQDTTLRGAVSNPPRDVSAQRFVNGLGQTISFAAESGRINLVYFGYTSCPDVCPTTLSDLRTAKQSLGKKDSAKVRVMMVSIDPARDSQAIMDAYVTKFFPAAETTGLRTDDQGHLTEVTAAFGASYEVTDSPILGGAPNVSHTSWVYAVDDTGRIVDQWSTGTKPSDISHDLIVLLR